MFFRKADTVRAGPWLARSSSPLCRPQCHLLLMNEALDCDLQLAGFGVLGAGEADDPLGVSAPRHHPPPPQVSTNTGSSSARLPSFRPLANPSTCEMSVHSNHVFMGLLSTRCGTQHLVDQVPGILRNIYSLLTAFVYIAITVFPIREVNCAHCRKFADTNLHAGKTKITHNLHPGKTMVLYSGVCSSGLIWLWPDSVKLNKVWLHILDSSKASQAPYDVGTIITPFS